MEWNGLAVIIGVIIPPLLSSLKLFDQCRKLLHLSPAHRCLYAALPTCSLYNRFKSAAAFLQSACQVYTVGYLKTNFFGEVKEGWVESLGSVI